MSIGTVNAISAVVAEDPAKPTVRTRRTALTFDEAGRPRIGAINEFASAITDFADLSREPEPMVIAGRFYSATNLIAAVATGLIELAEPAAGVVLTYPATYTEKQVALLGQALHLAGAGQVLLAPEPVAAAEWLEVEHGPLAPGFVLVYDLGANSLDLTVLRVGPDWPHHPMVGTPARSTDFGGKPLGEMVARYAVESRNGRATATLTSMVNTDSLRAEHIRDTFPLVSKTVAAAGLRLADISRILLVGGATRPPEVARTLAELGVPLVTVADPGQVVAAGAAALAARTFAPAQQSGNSAPHVAVFSSAAVVSALAMSAMTVFGSPFDPGLTPVLERFPALGAPADALLYDMSADLLAAQTTGLVNTIDPVTGKVRVVSAAARTAYEMIVGAASGAPERGASQADSEGGERFRAGGGDCRSPVLARTSYGDPAHFVNPLPFDKPSAESPTNPGSGPGPITKPGPGPITDPGPIAGVPSAGSPNSEIPSAGAPTIPGDTSLPAPGTGAPDVSPPATDGIDIGVSDGIGSGPGPSDNPYNPGGTGGIPSGGTSGGYPGGTGGTDSGASTGGTTGGTSGGVSGGTSGGASGGTAGGTSGGTSGGSDAGGSTGGASGGDSGGAGSGGTSGDSSSGGSTSGGTSGGSTSGGSTSGGTSGGSTSGGTSGGSTSGGTSGGSASGGSTSGGSTSGGTSGGSDSGGSSGGDGGGGGGGSRR